jgi:hypothetical protein
MYTERDVLVIQEHRRDAMAYAAQERLIRQARAPWARAYRRWLARLGAQMVDWGGRLQTRYAHPSLPSRAA